MAKTSSHVIPVKSNTEVHNFRRYDPGKEPDYLRKDLSHKNQSFVESEIHPTRKEIQELYKKSTGQKLQAKATPIRESVVVLDKNTTMDQLKNLGKAFEEKFGVRTMQIHIHDDEGHWSKKTGEWMPNRHAHMVFNWTDRESGKTLKLNRKDMMEMQTITAEQLGMERGASSDRKHLNTTQYKTKIREEELREAEQELERVKKDMNRKAKGAAVKGLSKLVGMDADKKKIYDLTEKLANTTNDFNELVDMYRDIREENETLKKRLSKTKELYERENNRVYELDKENRKLAETNQENEKYRKYWLNRKAEVEKLKTTIHEALKDDPDPEARKELIKIFREKKKEQSKNRDRGWNQSHTLGE